MVDPRTRSAITIRAIGQQSDPQAVLPPFSPATVQPARFSVFYMYLLNFCIVSTNIYFVLIASFRSCNRWLLKIYFENFFFSLFLLISPFQPSVAYISQIRPALIFDFCPWHHFFNPLSASIHPQLADSQATYPPGWPPLTVGEPTFLPDTTLNHRRG